MTHPHPTIKHASACYVLAISHLINNPGDYQGAFQVAQDYATTEGNDDINDWFRFLFSGAKMSAVTQTGWAKIGFTHAFDHLRRGSRYEEAIRETLELGGDTRFNAGFIGGMVGAIQGVEGLPGRFVKKVTEYCYEKKQGVKRPDFLDHTKIVEQLDQLFAMAPTETTVVIGEQEEAL
jgi:ADP-ribosylglycohydrolase